MGMLGLRDFVVVAHHQHADPHFSDHPHPPPSQPPNSATALGIGVGVFPLLAAASAPSLAPPPDAGGTKLGSNHSGDLGQNGNWGGGGGGVGVIPSSGSAIACRDCGNKAKRDCKYRRCRTCCKSRGYDCFTHVKSTWVPASRRRERQMRMAPGSGGGVSSGSSSGVGKRPRVLGSSQKATTSHNSVSTKSSDTSSNQQGFKETLPGQLRARAVFRCVRVSGIEDGDDEFAYQATVRIGGHMFKGFLYDQGVDEKKELDSCEQPNLRDSSSSPNVIPPNQSICGLVGGTA